MSRAALAPLLVATTLLSGCASSLSGVGGISDYACKAPQGASCMSVSGVYANTTHGALRIPMADKPAASALAAYGATQRPSPTSTIATPPAALRSAPRILRMWVAPWEDADGDLHEEGVVHVLVDTGRWLVEHVRPSPRSRMDRVMPPAAPSPGTPAAPASSAPAPALLPLPPTGFPPSEGSSSMEP